MFTLRPIQGRDAPTILLQVREFILAEMSAECKAAKLKAFELPKAVYLATEINDLGQAAAWPQRCGSGASARG